MTPAELRAAGRLGGLAFGGLVSRIEQVHQAIAGGSFGPAGPAGAPARVVHDTVARGTYLLVRTAGLAAATAAGQAASLLGAGGEPAGRDRAGSLALAALNAVAGDRFGPGLEPLAIEMAVRAGGGDVGLTAGQVAAAFPGATPDLAVFVHGLAETDESWRRRAGDWAPYGDRLRAQFGYTPVYVRYNTGRHVSDSGRDLADLLDGLERAWPEPVREILLAGHSMGGLVIRSACHYGREASAGWVDRVRHVFYLGSPHLGAPLARAAGVAGQILGMIPETRPFAGLAAGPASVRDLRHGYLLDDDWAGCGRTAACAITGPRLRCWPARTTMRSAPRSPPIPRARSAPWSATCSSSPPAHTGGAAPASTSRSPSTSAAGSARCTTSTC
jgi:hypothetical protein